MEGTQVTIAGMPASSAGVDQPASAVSAVELTVVMPCLNEEETIAFCIQQARDGIARLAVEGEIVVADNGSSDRSVAVAESLGARVVHVPERGYGNAYRAGIAAARGRIIVIGDSDGSYDFSRLDALVEPLRNGADMVLGSRLRGSIEPGAMPWLHRYLGNPLLSATLNFFFRTTISDTHSGFRAFTRDVYERMDLRSTGMEYASEMIIAAAHQGLRIAEIPITYRPRGGESKLRSFRDGWRHLRLLLLYSPRHLFTIPGLLMAGAGVAILLALAGGPIAIGGRLFDFHFMFPGALLVMLGTQVALLGLFARSTAGPPEWFTLERGLLAGMAVLLAGLGVNLYIVIHWIGSAFGPLYAVRPAVLGLTLMVTGAQILFSSFYLDLLRLERQRTILPGGHHLR